MGYREDQDAQLAKQAKQQIEYCEQKERERQMARRGPKPKIATQAIALTEALQFVGYAAQRDESRYMQHVQFNEVNGTRYVVAFDGQVSAGYPIVEELSVCPHWGQFSAALAKCGKTLAITETDAGRLSIKGDKLRAVVQCLPSSDMAPVYPDALAGPATDILKAAFECCGVLVKESETRIIGASLLLENGQCTGTNGAAMLQFWHGVSMPCQAVIPKVFAAAVAKAKPAIIGIGGTMGDNGRLSSVTIHFDNGAWLKTQTYADPWPDVTPLFQQAFYTQVPEGLFEAIATVAEFSDEGYVNFVDNAVWSHSSLEVGAQYDVPGLQGGKRFDGKLVKQVAPYVGSIDLTSYPDRAFFIAPEGIAVRGVIMGITPEVCEEAKPEPAPAKVNPWAAAGVGPSVDKGIPYE
jgi:hypothetical protein